MTNEQLLAAIRSRGQKATEFGYGIQTADVYVRTLAERIGIDSCYKHVADRKTSLDDLMQKAGRTLVYSNPSMTIESKDVDKIRKDHDIELPKNTLMAFRHVLTTSTKDRDGDVLHAGGAKPDPKMLMLFQHLHNSPIGKAITIADQTDEYLKMISCIVDINPLSHDCAVMIDNDMGRFSHGFRAIDFDEIKEGDSKKPNGSFEIREFEIMEESLVSVPANIDATTEEVMLSLVEGGKLTSPLMKVYGKTLRDKRPVSVPVTFREIQCNSFDELKQAHDAGLIAGAAQEKSDEQDDKGLTAPASEKAGKTDDNKGHGEDGKAEGSDKEIVCPKCGGTLKDGKCSECGYVMPKLDEGGKVVVGGKPEDGEKYYAAIDNSYEWVRDQLNPQVGNLLAPAENELCYIEATFSDHVIVQKDGKDAPTYYRIAWEMKDGKPELGTEAKPVEIEPARVRLPKGTKPEGIKQGRAFSKANEVRLQDAVDDLAELSKMDIPRSAKALVKSASGTLAVILKQLEKPETQDPEQQSTMALFVANASPTERKQMKELLAMFEKTEQRAKEVRQYRGLFPGKTRRAK